LVSVYILVDGPHALPGEKGYFFGLFPRDTYRWYWALVTIPFAQIAFGMLLGAVGFKWLADLADPRSIATEPQQIAHRRWGFVLLTLLVIGTLYPSLRTLTFNSAQVKTPIGDVSLAASPRASAEKTTGPPPLESVPLRAVRGEGNAPPPRTITLIVGFASRDREYDEFFLHGHPAGKDDAAIFQHVWGLHKDSNPFVNLVLQPVADCVSAFYDTIQSQHRLRDQIVDAVERYDIALHDPSEKNVEELYKGFLGAVNNMTEHIRFFPPHVAPACEKAARDIASARTQKAKFATTLPYPHITFAHLASSIGSPDIGALRLAAWIERQLAQPQSNPASEANRLRATA
jgi:hypothetical protein